MISSLSETTAQDRKKQWGRWGQHQLGGVCVLCQVPEAMTVGLYVVGGQKGAMVGPTRLDAKEFKKGKASRGRGTKKARSLVDPDSKASYVTRGICNVVI